jgi:hypothetical protein
LPLPTFKQSLSVVLPDRDHRSNSLHYDLAQQVRANGIAFEALSDAKKSTSGRELRGCAMNGSSG